MGRRGTFCSNRPRPTQIGRVAPHPTPENPTAAAHLDPAAACHRSTARQHDDVPKRERVGAKRNWDDGGPWRGTITGRRVHQNPGDGGWRHDGGSLAPVSNRRESDRPRAPDFLQPRPPRTNEAPQAHRKPQYALPPSFGHGGNLLRDRGGLHGASPHLGYK